MSEIKYSEYASAHYFVYNRDDANHFLESIRPLFEFDWADGKGVKWGTVLGPDTETLQLTWSVANSDSEFTEWHYSWNVNERFGSDPSDAEIQALENAFKIWEEYVDVEFSQVIEDAKTKGNIRTFFIDMGATGIAYLAPDGEFHINNTLREDLVDDESSFGEHIVVHEIGHAVFGLNDVTRVPGWDEPGGAEAKLLPWYLNNQSWTVMSYISVGSTYSTSPMILDVAAVQALYGANMSTGLGDTIYSWNDYPIYTIWDVAGIDTVDLSNFSDDIVFSTTPGSLIEINDNSVVGIAEGVTIENFMGGLGNDIFYYKSGNKIFSGNQGNDVFIVDAQNNSLQVSGGSGIDALIVNDNSFRDGNLEEQLWFSDIEVFGDRTEAKNLSNTKIASGETPDKIYISLGNVEDSFIQSSLQHGILGKVGVGELAPETVYRSVSDNANIIMNPMGYLFLPDALVPFSGTGTLQILSDESNQEIMFEVETINVDNTYNIDVSTVSENKISIFDLSGNDQLIIKINDLTQVKDVYKSAEDIIFEIERPNKDDLQIVLHNQLNAGLIEQFSLHIADEIKSFHTLPAPQILEIAFEFEANETDWNFSLDQPYFLVGTDIEKVVWDRPNSAAQDLYFYDDFLISGARSDDLIFGGPGADRVYGYEGNDTILGGTGNDSLGGWGGNDIIYGQDGNDIINGDDGDDVIYGGDGNDGIDGGSGNDIIYLGGGIERGIVAESEPYVYNGVSYDQDAVGSGGDDVIYASDLDDWLRGGDGNDVIYGYAGDDLIEEVNDDYGDDIFYGGDGDDIIRDYRGSDRIYGEAGNDKIYADYWNTDLAGNDYVDAGSGDDHVETFGGDDFVVLSTGNDYSDGGNGIDTVILDDLFYAIKSITGPINDFTINTEIKSDEIYSSYFSSFEAISFGDQIFTIEEFLIEYPQFNLTTSPIDNDDNSNSSTPGDDVSGDAGDNILIGTNESERIFGWAGSDLIVAYDGDDEIFGDDEATLEPGNDWIFAGAGSDFIRGEGGSDVIDPGLGDDTVEADGPGAENNNTSGNDIIIFSLGNDQVNGGVGDDTLVLNGLFKHITQISGGNDSFSVTSNFYDDVYVSVFNSIEFLEFDGDRLNFDDFNSKFNNTLEAASNEIIGTSADDYCVSLGAEDLIKLEAGDDRIYLSSPDVFAAGFAAMNATTGDRISVAGMTKFSSVIDGGQDVDTIYLTDDSNGDAFFLHDSYSGLHESLTAVGDGFGRETVVRVLSIETINAGDGDDVIDLTSPTFNMGNMAINLNGEAGDDIIWAAEGNDTLDGGIGNDTLFGGSGDDTLTGGDGRDIFEFTQSAQDDRITDYEVGQDVIKLYRRDTDTKDWTFTNSQLEWGQVDVVIDGITEIDQLTVEMVLI